jgi:hypothetical protein
MDVTDIQMMQNGVMNPQQQAALDRWDSLITETDNAADVDGRFADADAEEEEEES